MKYYTKELGLTDSPYLSRITDFAFFGASKLATYSAIDNHLVVSDINTGAVELSKKDKLVGPNAVIEGLTGSASSGRLCVLTVNQGNQEYAVQAFAEDLKNIEVLQEGLKVAVAEGQNTKSRYVVADGRIVRLSVEEVEGQAERLQSIEIANL